MIEQNVFPYCGSGDSRIQIEVHRRRCQPLSDRPRGPPCHSQMRNKMMVSNFSFSCDRLLRRTKKKKSFRLKWSFCPRQIFAEGCQCSTAHHPRAPGNMSPHHLVNKTFSQKRWRCILLTWVRIKYTFLIHLLVLFWKSVHLSVSREQNT